VVVEWNAFVSAQNNVSIKPFKHIKSFEGESRLLHRMIYLLSDYKTQHQLLKLMKLGSLETLTEAVMACFKVISRQLPGKKKF
jgi:hypothetical protein